MSETEKIKADLEKRNQKARLCNKIFYEKHGRKCICRKPKHSDEVGHSGDLIEEVA